MNWAAVRVADLSGQIQAWLVIVAVVAVALAVAASIVSMASTGRRRKWRFHCATCGTYFPDAPRLYAYCDKACERERTGPTERPPQPEWAVDRILDLRERLSTLPNNHERDEVLAEIRALQNTPEEVVSRENFSSERMSQSAAEFWSWPIQREAAKLEAAMRRSLAAAVKLGDMLLEAKAAVAHGEFGRLFHDHESPVDHPLPFSRRWATQLMRIAENDAIVNGKHASHLPADLDTVAQLARLDSSTLEEAIEQGAVHPKMSRADVRTLAPARQAKPVTPDERMTRLLDSFQRQVEQFSCDVPSLASELRARIKALWQSIGRGKP